MDNNKLTDNEIIKALNEAFDENWIILGLINRLQAEKEDYKILYENLKAEHTKTIKAIKQCKAEAYKECVEKVKAIATKRTYVYIADVSLQEQEIGWLEIREDNLDNLLKELVGDNK